MKEITEASASVGLLLATALDCGTECVKNDYADDVHFALTTCILHSFASRDFSQSTV